MDIRLEDYETKMVPSGQGKRTRRMVLIVCEYCGEDAWVRWEARKRGDWGKFCNRSCSTRYRNEKRISQYNLNDDEIRMIKDGKYYRRYKEVRCKFCSKLFWAKEAEIKRGAGVFCSQSCASSSIGSGRIPSVESRKKMSEAHRRNNVSNKWKTKTKTYPPEFSEYLKDRIRDRDGHCCRICSNSRKKKKNFPVHHIDGNPYNNDERNLITLCWKCHVKIHRKSKESNLEILAFRSMLHWNS